MVSFTNYEIIVRIPYEAYPYYNIKTPHTTPGLKLNVTKMSLLFF